MVNAKKQPCLYKGWHLSMDTKGLETYEGYACFCASADVWMITPSALGDGIASGAFMDLSQLVLFDQKLQWQGLISQMRSVGLVYGSKVRDNFTGLSQAV